MIVAERIRKLVEVAGSPALSEPGSHPRLSTVSCGGASCYPNDTTCKEDLLDAADKALYQAKELGRNLVYWGEWTSRRKESPSSYKKPLRISVNTDSIPLTGID